MLLTPVLIENSTSLEALLDEDIKNS